MCNIEIISISEFYVQNICVYAVFHRKGNMGKNSWHLLYCLSYD